VTLIAATRTLQARGRPPRSTNSPPRPAPLGRDSGLAYFAPLDGMRGLAVLLVFGGHFAATWLCGQLEHAASGSTRSAAGVLNETALEPGALALLQARLDADEERW